MGEVVRCFVGGWERTGGSQTFSSCSSKEAWRNRAGETCVAFVVLAMPPDATLPVTTIRLSVFLSLPFWLMYGTTLVAPPPPYSTTSACPPPTPISYSAPPCFSACPTLPSPTPPLSLCFAHYCTVPFVTTTTTTTTITFSPPLPQSNQGIGRLLPKRQIAGGCQGEQGPRGPAQRDQGENFRFFYVAIEVFYFAETENAAGLRCWCMQHWDEHAALCCRLLGSRTPQSSTSVEGVTCAGQEMQL